jgi:isoleucyl-tRNA synthetase
VPFLAEAMWQNLAVCSAGVSPARAVGTAVPQSPQVAESVHLCDYPIGDPAAVDVELSKQMALAREIVSLGLSARMGAKLKVRQPLSQVEVVLADATHREWLEEHASLICKELNVKRVEFVDKAEQYITYTVLPDLKRLGPRLGKRLPAVRKLLGEADGGRLLAQLEADGRITLALQDGPITLDSDDIQVRLQAKEGWAAAQGHSVVVVLAIELTDELIREGLARELVRTIQDRRKEMGCEFTDRIVIGIETESAELKAAVDQFRDYICGETLIGFMPDRLSGDSGEGKAGLCWQALPGAEPVETSVGDHPLTLYVKVS